MTRLCGLSIAGVWWRLVGLALLLAVAAQTTAALAQLPPPTPGSNLNFEPSEGSTLYPPLAPKIENPFGAIPYDSAVAKLYTDTSRTLRSWLKLPCIDQADKDKVVASAREVGAYLKNWSEIWGPNETQRLEADLDATEIYDLSVKVERMKVCAPHGAAPPPPVTETPPPEQPPGAGKPPAKCLTPAETKELEEVEEKIRDLDGQISQFLEYRQYWENRIGEDKVIINGIDPSTTDPEQQSKLLNAQRDLVRDQKFSSDVDKKLDDLQKEQKQAEDRAEQLRQKQCPDQSGAVLPQVPLSNGVFVAVQTGPAFSNTAHFSNADLGDDARARFGTGFQIGGEVGVPVVPGLNFGVEGLYTGGLSPTFTGGMEKATGSAHAETFLAHVWFSPLLFKSRSSPVSAPPSFATPIGPVQPYVDVGLGASVNTMGQLTGHSSGIPTGTGPGETKVNFAWQAGAGLQFDTGVPGLTARVGYDYLHLGNFSTTNTFNLFSGPAIVRPPFNVNVNESVIKAELIIHLTPMIVPPHPP